MLLCHLEYLHEYAGDGGPCVPEGPKDAQTSSDHAPDHGKDHPEGEVALKRM